MIDATKDGSSAPASAAAPQPLWAAPMLAAVAGAVDTTGFVLLGGIFCAHVTGNFVLLGAMLNARDHTLLVAKLSVLPLFILGIVLGWWITRVGGRRAAQALALAEALFLGVSAGAVLVPSDLVAHGVRWWSQLAAAVIAMGVHSMLSRSLRLPMTNVMTGNVTQLTVDFIERRRRPDAGRGVARGVVLVSAFAAGAVAAGLGSKQFGFGVLVVPALMLLAIAASVRNARPQS